MPETSTEKPTMGLSFGLFMAAILASIAILMWPSHPQAPPPAGAPSAVAASSGAPHPPAAEEPTEGSSPRRVRWADVELPEPPKDMAKLVAQGEGLYKQQCLVCHGPEGKGDGPAAPNVAAHPRDFTRGNFKFKTSGVGEMPWDDDIFRTVTSGIPAAGMPSFGDTPAEERWALVAYVKTLSKRTADDGDVVDFFADRPAQTRLTVLTGRTVTPEAIARGKGIYAGEQGGCLNCHGPAGLGDGISAKDLKDDAERPIAPANLTRGEVTFKTGYRPEDIYRTLTNGMAGTPMPSFRKSLTDDERWDVACFVTSLYKPIPPGELTFLKVGCKSCHTVGGGKLIGPDLAGVTQRRDEGWIRTWLKDPPSMLATDPTARKLFEEYLTPMPSYGLTQKEIDSLIEYLRSAPPAPQK